MAPRILAPVRSCSGGFVYSGLMVKPLVLPPRNNHLINVNTFISLFSRLNIIDFLLQAIYVSFQIPLKIEFHFLITYYFM